MTPLEQANALLKAAEEATAAPWEYSDCGAVNSANNQPDWMDWSNNGEELFVGGPPLNQRKAADAAFIALARNTAPAIASALLEKQKALEAAEAEIETLKSTHPKFATSSSDYWQRVGKAPADAVAIIQAIDEVIGDWMLDDDYHPGMIAIRNKMDEARAFLARQGETA